MKTYEETLKSVLRKAAECEKQNEKKKKRLSLIAAVAAALILFTALPVGAVIISRQANQPAEMYKTATETVAGTVTEKAPDKTILSENAEYIRNLTTSGSKTSGSGAIYGDGMDMNLDITPETSILVDGGFLHHVLVRCFRPVPSDSDDYQADILVTDGSVELYHLTYKTKIDVSCSIHSFNFDLFVPDGLEYGEVHFYLNILKDENETIGDYSSEPFGECCVNFVQKYGLIRCSPGVKVPEADRMTLLTGISNGLHDSILWAVGQLYRINESLENDRLNNNSRYEDDLRMKPIWEKILISYRSSNEEEYNRIISEFVDSSPKVYDKYGNLKEPSIQLHDPLEDIAK